MDTHRRERLERVVQSLGTLPGICAVQSDDWDSSSVNIFVRLRVDTQFSARPRIFQVPVRSLKLRIKNLLRDLGYECCFLAQPERLYSWIPKILGSPRERVFEGYDRDDMKLEVFL